MWQIQDSARVSKLVLCENALPSEPSSIAFDRTGALVALCCDRVVQVFVVERREVFITLEGHLARVSDIAQGVSVLHTVSADFVVLMRVQVTKCEFHPIRHHLLITCSEDRTFKVCALA